MCCECKITLDSSWKLTQNLEQFTMATLKGCLQTGLQLSQSFAFFALPSKGGGKRRKKKKKKGNCSLLHMHSYSASFHQPYVSLVVFTEHFLLHPTSSKQLYELSQSTTQSLLLPPLPPQQKSNFYFSPILIQTLTQ